MASERVFQSDNLLLRLNASGQVTELRDRIADVDRVSGTVYFCRISVSSSEQDPVGYDESGDTLTFTFSGGRTVVLRLTERTSHLLVELVSCSDQTDLDWIHLVNLRGTAALASGLNGTRRLFARYSGDRYMAVYPLSRHTRALISPTGGPGGTCYAQAAAYPAMSGLASFPGIAGAKAALFACDATPAATYAAAAAADVDSANGRGGAAKQNPWLSRSRIYIVGGWPGQPAMTFDERGEMASWIDQAMPDGGTVVMIQSAWRDLRKRLSVRDDVWGTNATLADWIAGLKGKHKVTLHNQALLVPFDHESYAKPAISSKLSRHASTTLAATLPASETTALTVNDDVTGWPAPGIVEVEGEAIRYETVSGSGPTWTLGGGLIRAYQQGTSPGSNGTGVEHLGGASVGGMQTTPEFDRYVLSIDAGGGAEAAADMAALYSELGVQGAYFDDTDTVSGGASDPWYSHNLIVGLALDAGLPAEIIESASQENWALIDSIGQIDWVAGNAFIAEVDRTLASIASVQIGSLGPHVIQLGWARVNEPAQAEVTPVELEYLLRMSLAWGYPVAMFWWADTQRSWKHGRANRELIGVYERLRLQGLVDAGERTAAQAGGDTRMWIRTAAGANHLALMDALTIEDGAAMAGWITNAAVDGHKYVTCWSLDGAAKWVRFPAGVAADDVAAWNLDGSTIAPVTLPDGRIALYCASRVYLQLIDMADPVATFAAAVVAANAWSSGERTAGTVGEHQGTGTVAWSPYANVQGAADGAYATATLPVPQRSYYALCTNYGFVLGTHLHADWPVRAMSARAVCSRGSSGTIRDNRIHWVIGGSPAGASMADGVNWSSSGLASKSWSSLAGLNPTAAQLAAAGFGLAVSAKNQSGIGGPHEARLDAVYIAIEQSPGGAGGFQGSAGVLLAGAGGGLLSAVRRRRR